VAAIVPVTVSVFVPLKTKFALPARLPPLLNMTCVLLPGAATPLDAIARSVMVDPLQYLISPEATSTTGVSWFGPNVQAARADPAPNIRMSAKSAAFAGASVPVSR
jgi:hypothetical protein